MNILNKLTIRQLKMNKQRTIVTIIGVILSCALMVGIGLLFSSVQRNMVDSIVKYNGDYHTSFEDVSKKDLSLVENNVKVKNYARRSLEMDAVRYGSETDETDYFHIYTMNQEYQDSFRELKGRLPKNGNEILVAQRIMKTKNPQLKIGDTITLKIGEFLPMEDDSLSEYEAESSEPKFQEQGEKTFKIVGTYVGDAYGNYFQGYIGSMYIGGNMSENASSTVYITYKNLRDTYPESEHLAEQLHKTKTSDDGMYSGLNYNQEYLSLNGNSRYQNYNFTLIAIVAFILTLISIACIVVIYN
ncbi:MAG: ABC transporter permease [Firmicutes bacterium]|nr:ABC transporter permease [Bacillota bacterium]